LIAWTVNRRTNASVLVLPLGTVSHEEITINDDTHATHLE